MKKLILSRRHGFTLVELLIVIAIIMVLAALGFAGVTRALKRAKSVQSLNIATGLAQSVHSFYDEYGALPASEPTKEPLSTTAAGGVDVLRVLLAQETGTTILNSRGIRFLDPKQAKGKKGGIDFGANGATLTAMYDAFGYPFYIAFDEDYNDEIENPAKVKATDPDILRGFKAVVYSAGADGVLKTSDDVKTW
jgi:hypothetical protein